jgi:hypothetical protein
MSSDPTWTADFLTKKDEKTTHVLALSEFVPQTRGRKLTGLTLDRGSVCYVGLILSLVDQEGNDNPHFGDGPFKLLLHELEFISESNGDRETLAEAGAEAEAEAGPESVAAATETNALLP